MVHRLLPALALLVNCAAPIQPGGGGPATSTGGSGGTVATTSPTATQTPTAGAVDVDGDSFLAPEDCDDLDPTSFPGKVENPCDGRDNDCAGDGDDRTGCDLDFATADLVIPNPVGATFSLSLPDIRAHQDASGDDVMDVWSRLEVAGTTHYYAWSLAGRTAAEPFADISNTWAVLFPGDTDGDGLDNFYDGTLHSLPLVGAVATVGPPPTPLAGLTGDWNNDGVREFLGLDDDGNFGWLAGPLTTLVPFESVTRIEQDESGGGEMVFQVLDIDGDGVDEFLAATTYPGGPAGQHESDDNALHVFGGTPGPGAWATEEQTLIAGWTFKVVDLNADAFADIVSFAGDIRVAYGPFDGSGEQLLSERVTLTTGNTGRTTGLAVVPDFDGNGTPEVLFTCADRVVMAELSAPGSLPDACTAGRTFVGVSAGYGVIEHFFDGGDFDGDGLGDVAIADVADGSTRVWFGHSN